MDWNNISPSVGLAWTPSVKGGPLRKLTGNTGDFVVRGGLQPFVHAAWTHRLRRAGRRTIRASRWTVNRTLALGNLGPLPLLMRNGNLSPAAFPSEFQSSRSPKSSTGDITIFSPDLVVPYADTWQAGIQRSLGQTMSIEARYVGARSGDNWRTNNYNELNIIENGFLDEFKLAMANLQANNAAGGTRAGSFAYFGDGTGHRTAADHARVFQRRESRRRGQRRGLYVRELPGGHLRRSAGAVQSASRTRSSTACETMRRRATARSPRGCRGTSSWSIPISPAARTSSRTAASTLYNSMVLEFRRRSVEWPVVRRAATCWAMPRSRTSCRCASTDPMLRNGGEEGDVSHALKLNLVYPLPFGRGQRFGSNANGFVDRIIGGWQLAFNARVQSGRLLDLGNVRLVGMNEKELQKAFKLRIDDQQRVFMLPQDIIDNTFKAFSVSATSATGYSSNGPPSGRYMAPADSFDCIETIRGEGKCGVQSLVVQGPLFQQYDLSIVKRIALWGSVNAEFRLDALNVFDNVNFSPVTGITVADTNQNTNVNWNRAVGSTQTAYETTALTGVNTSRVLQIVSRIRW